MSPSEDHRCRGGKWCAARCGDSPAATTKQGTLCQACITHIQACRDALTGLREAVQVFIGIKPVTALTSKIAASKEPSSPLNLAAETLAGDIGEVLSRVGNYLVRDLVSQPSKRFMVWVGDVEQIAVWDGVDLALQIRSVHQRSVKLLGFEAQWERRAAPCRVCGLPALGQLSGSGTVECSSCGDRMTLADYENHCSQLVRGK